MNYARKHRQTVTHWPFEGMDRYQSATYGSPYTRRCRREQEIRTLLDQDGEERSSKAAYYMDDAQSGTTDPQIGDYLALGDHTGTSNPHDVSSAERIIEVDADPDIRVTQTLFKAMV